MILGILTDFFDFQNLVFREILMKPWDEGFISSEQHQGQGTFGDRRFREQRDDLRDPCLNGFWVGDRDGAGSLVLKIFLDLIKPLSPGGHGFENRGS